jgi:hypothetical protein
MAAAILCLSLRPNRRSDLSAAGRTSMRQPPGSASVQLRLDLGPRDTGLLPGLADRPTVLVGQLLFIEGRSIELGDDRVLGTPEQDRRSGQRFIGERVDEAMKLGLGHGLKVAPKPAPPGDPQRFGYRTAHRHLGIDIVPLSIRRQRQIRRVASACFACGRPINDITESEHRRRARHSRPRSLRASLVQTGSNVLWKEASTETEAIALQEQSGELGRHSTTSDYVTRVLYSELTPLPLR